MSCSRLKLRERLRRQRRGAGNEEAHPLAGLPCESRASEQPRVERRHPHHDRRIRQVSDHRICIETGQEDHGSAAKKYAVQRDKQPMHVEDR